MRDRGGVRSSIADLVVYGAGGISKVNELDKNRARVRLGSSELDHQRVAARLMHLASDCVTFALAQIPDDNMPRPRYRFCRADLMLSLRARYKYS